MNEEGPHADAAERRPRLRKQVLLVDDNVTLTRGMALLFRDGGYDPKVFNAGLTAIEAVRKLDDRGSICAAVIDIHLPDINGLILSRQLRDLLGLAVPIIVLSGDASMEVLNSLAHVGATYFFSKPVNGTMLVDRVRELTT